MSPALLPDGFWQAHSQVHQGAAATQPKSTDDGTIHRNRPDPLYEFLKNTGNVPGSTGMFLNAAVPLLQPERDRLVFRGARGMPLSPPR